MNISQEPSHATSVESLVGCLRSTRDRSTIATGESGTKINGWKLASSPVGTHDSRLESRDRCPEKEISSRQSEAGKGEDDCATLAELSVSEDVTRQNTTAGISAYKETKIKTSNRVRDAENLVAIKLTPLDQPGTSKSLQSNKKSASDPIRVKKSKATQMRQNLSTQRLQVNDDTDDDSSQEEDVETRQKFILIGWDNFRCKLMILLLALLFLWAVIYFPLFST